MTHQYKSGRPPELTSDLIDHIIKHVPQSYTMNQVARRALVSHQRLYEWHKKGLDDLYTGQDSIYAQFTAKYEQIKGNDVETLIKGMLKKGCWQAYHELLKATSVEDFGKDVELYKQLLKDYKDLADRKTKK